ncbi:hypothetical protein [Qipengyuania sp. MTN3-11]|uniref:phage adaptor protein n=1 Tax=Qipengyuania sp. MTN3-11 TaxID=3056557 RepID=UPI0036F33DE0
MTVLAAMQSAAIRLIGRKPSTFFGATQTFELEMCDLVNEVATDIAKYDDWQALTRIATISGDGTTTEFDLPDDYDRFTIAGAMQDGATWAWGYRHYQSLDQFLFDEIRGFNATPGGWIIYGGKLRFSPVPSATAQARFPYITKNIALDESTAPKAAFTADQDSFVLPERLLTLGLVWRWRENKKLDATGDQEAFIKALDEYAAKDGGPTVIRRNARSGFGNTHLAYPWELGPANYWPAG